MPWQCGGRADGSRACAGLGADGMLAEHPAELVFTADETTQELAVSSRRGDHSATRFGREITDAERLAGIAQARCIGKLAVEVIVERFGIGAAQAEIDQQLLIMTAVVAETADVPGREGRVATACKAALHGVIAIAQQRIEPVVARAHGERVDFGGCGLALRTLDHVGAKYPFGGRCQPHRLVGADALALLPVHQLALGVTDFPVVIA